MEDGIGYKIGYAIGYLGVSFLRLLYNGVVTISKRYIAFIFIYLGYFVGMLAAYNTDNDMTIFIYLFVLTACIGGIWNHIIQYPNIKLTRKFNTIFEKVKLQTSDGNFPEYMRMEESEYATAYIFYSLLPLSEWRKKREEMEMYINKKVVDILQDEENNRIICLIVQKASLPAKFDWDDKYLDVSNAPNLSLGMGYYDLVLLDLNKYPHTFIAGSTGSGKSNLLKCLIHQSLRKHYDVTLIDFKRGISFSEFGNRVRIYYEHDTTSELLQQLVEETKQRLDLFRTVHVDNIDDYNTRFSYMRRKVIFIDELAELLQVRDKELSRSLYDSLETLTRLSRATGIHLMMGIQRVDSTVINGQIKSNVSGRICGRFVDKEPSRIMLGNDMASTLPNTQGRFIFKGDTFVEMQCFYFQSINHEPYNNSIQNDTFTQVDKLSENIEVETEGVRNQIAFDFSDIE